MDATQTKVRPNTPKAAYAWDCGYLAAKQGLDKIEDNPYRHEVTPWDTEAKIYWDNGYSSAYADLYLLGGFAWW